MRERIAILTIIFLFGASWCVAKEKDCIFNVAKCYHNGEQMIYAVAGKDEKGNPIYTGTFTYRITIKDDILTIQGLSDYSNDYLLEKKFQYDLKTNLPIGSYIKEGKTENYKEVFAGFQKDEIRINTIDKDRKGENKRTLKKKGVVYNAESSGFLLRDYPFGSKEKIYFKLLVDHEKVYTLAAEKIGEEKIVVPMGEFDCYKLKYKATGDILTELFAPTLYIWFSKEDHKMVKFVDEDVVLSLKAYKQ